MPHQVTTLKGDLVGFRTRAGLSGEGVAVTFCAADR